MRPYARPELPLGVRVLAGHMVARAGGKLQKRNLLASEAAAAAEAAAAWAAKVQTR